MKAWYGFPRNLFRRCRGFYREMLAVDMRKAELARRLGWHKPQVDRLLDLRHDSRLDQIERAFAVLGKRVRIAIESAA